MRFVARCPSCNGDLYDVDTFDAGMGTIWCPNCQSVLRKNVRLEHRLRTCSYLLLCVLYFVMVASFETEIFNRTRKLIWISLWIVPISLLFIRSKWHVDPNPVVAPTVPEGQPIKPCTCPACGNKIGYSAYCSFRHYRYQSALCPACLNPIKANPSATTFVLISYWLGVVLAFAIGMPLLYLASFKFTGPIDHLVAVVCAFLVMNLLSAFPKYWSYRRDPLIRGKLRSGVDSFMSMLADAKGRSDRRRVEMRK